MIKALIVDDSALMRKHLTNILEGDGGFTIRAARNGAEALTLIEEESFDVVTLDINMPVMDGLTCLSHIMTRKPMPVVMVSSLTREGAESTLEALNLGAVDYVQKPDGTISLSIERIERELIHKIRAAAGARIRRTIGLTGRIAAARQSASGARAARSVAAAGPSLTGRPGLVLVGVSTGGPSTIEEILSGISADFAWPIVIAQHMPGTFTGVFARRMDSICPLTVVEVDSQMLIEPGTVYVAKGDADLVISRRARGLTASPVPASREHLWHPSVARMVVSALEALPADRLVGVQLTGMGDDGAAAMADVCRRGGKTIAQDRDTSVVFGMPQELIRLGGASLVLPSHQIAGQLNQWFARAAKQEGGRTHAG